MNLISCRKTTASVADNHFAYSRWCAIVLVNLITIHMNIIYISRTASGGYYARASSHYISTRDSAGCMLTARAHVYVRVD